MSLTREEACVVSPYQPFVVVLKKRFLEKQISPFALNFECCNFADVFYCMLKQQHYTLTKVRKVKS